MGCSTFSEFTVCAEISVAKVFIFQLLCFKFTLSLINGLFNKLNEFTYR